MTKVLVVDDSALMRKVIGNLLRAAGGMELAFAHDGAEALAMLADVAPDVVTLDIAMPRMDGLTCLDRIMIERPCRVVMVSSLTQAGADAALEALALGAVDVIGKPDGVISLALDAFGPELVARVRAAASAQLRPASRLAERVRLRAGPAAGGASLPPPGRGVPTLAHRALHQPGGLYGGRLGADNVVIVGTSTGGPPALDTLLGGLPADFPWPILVAQHMPASFTGPLARRLDRSCRLRVHEVTAPMPIVAGSVYIAQGDADMVVAGRAEAPMVRPAPPDPACRWHPGVDRLVSSAMRLLAAPRLIGVLMTGMGNDGAAAMARLHREGGRTLAEAEETAVVWGMPGELVRAGGAGTVCRLDEIAAQLLAWSA